MNKSKIFGAVIGVIIFIICVAGLTYAWFTWTSTNTTIQGDSGCFTIQYTNGQAISGSISPSADYTGGKSTTATLNINSTCTTEGNATIRLTTNGTSTIILNENAVKYAVYQGTTEINSGVVTGNTQNLATVQLTKTATEYTVYVWVDGNIADNDYVGTSYTGSISVYATQVERTNP